MEWTEKINSDPIEMVRLSFLIGFKLTDYIFLPSKEPFDKKQYVIYDNIAIKKIKGIPFKYICTIEEGKCIGTAILVENRFMYSGGLGGEIDFSIGTLFYPFFSIIDDNIKKLEALMKENQESYCGYVAIDMAFDNMKQYYYRMSFHNTGIISDIAAIGDVESNKKNLFVSAARFWTSEKPREDKKIFVGKDDISYYAIIKSDKFSGSWVKIYDYLFSMRDSALFRVDGKSALRMVFVAMINFMRDVASGVNHRENKKPAK